MIRVGQNVSILHKNDASRALPGKVDRVGLIVSDGDRSAAFYTEYLGMELVRRSEGTQVTPIVGAVFDVPGAIIRRLIRLNRWGAFYLILFEFEPR